MADSNVDLIVAQINTIMSAVTGISKVTSYEPLFLDQYNSASIWWDGAKYTEQSIGMIEAQYRFVIQINVYLGSGVEAQTTLKDVVVAATQTLNANHDLNSSCLYHRIEEVSNSFVQQANTVYAVGMITLVAIKEEAV
jgi:hypothetical protein